MYTWFPAWRTNHFNAEAVMRRYRSGPLTPEQQTLITMLAHSLGWPVQDVARALLSSVVVPRSDLWPSPDVLSAIRILMAKLCGTVSLLTLCRTITKHGVLSQLRVIASVLIKSDLFTRNALRS